MTGVSALVATENHSVVDRDNELHKKIREPWLAQFCPVVAEPGCTDSPLRRQAEEGL